MNSRQRDDQHCENPEFKWTVEFGWVDLFTEYRPEGDGIVCYVWSIKRDMNGNEVSRTEPKAISRMSLASGQPKDYSATLIMLTVCGFALLKWWIG